MKNSIILLLFCLILVNLTNAQSSNRDSLLHQLSDLPDDTVKIVCLRSLAIYYHGRDIDSMYYYADQMESLSKNLDNSRGQIGAANFKGIICNQKGELEKALSYFQFCYDLSEKTGYKKGADVAFNNITTNLVKLKQYDKALANYEKLVKEFTQSNDTNNLLYPLMNIAVIYRETKNFAQAHSYIDRALEIAKHIKNDKAIVDLLVNKANIYGTEKKLADAEKYYLQALKICEEKGLTQEMERIKLNMAILSSAKGKHEEAKNVMKNILAKLPEDSTKHFIRMDTYVSLINQYEKLGKYDSAFKYLKEYNEINKKTYSDTLASLVNEFNVKYETDIKKKQIELLENENLVKELSFKKEQQQKTFAYAGIAAVIIIGSYGFYSFRNRKKLESQQALSNERLRISRELHDDIGSTLGSIAVYSDVAKNRTVKNENPAEILSKIGTASRELIEKMSDIVWSLNPDNETFEQLRNRMQGFAAMILTPRNIAVDFKTDDILKNIQLTSEQRRNIFLIYKEAVHNIVKYAECKTVLIAFLNSNNSISLIIKDDGKGFETPSLQEGLGGAYNGNGIKNMKARAADMKATLNIISKINEGTTIELLHV